MYGYVGKRKKEYWKQGFIASVLLSLVKTREQTAEEPCYGSSNWNKETNLGEMLDSGHECNIEDERTTRVFNTQSHELEGLSEKDNPKALDPYVSDIWGIYGSDIGPYETIEVDYHTGEYRTMIDLGASIDQALDWALYFQALVRAREERGHWYWLSFYRKARNEANSKIGSDASLRAGRHFHRSYFRFFSRKQARLKQEWHGSEPSEPTKVGFEPIILGKDEMVDFTLSPMEREREGHIEEQTQIEAFLNSPDSEKKLFGYLDQVVNFRSQRYVWLYRYFLSCQTKREVKIARSRLIESIDRNNKMIRKVEKKNSEAWVAAILNPSQKRSLMKLTNELLRERSLVPCLVKPDRNKRPWLP